jgi:hypothetical protein
MAGDISCISAHAAQSDHEPVVYIAGRWVARVF